MFARGKCCDLFIRSFRRDQKTRHFAVFGLRSVKEPICLLLCRRMSSSFKINIPLCATRRASGTRASNMRSTNSRALNSIDEILRNTLSLSLSGMGARCVVRVTKYELAAVEADNRLTAIICPSVCISKMCRARAQPESDDSKHKLVVARLIYPNMMNGLLYPRT